MSPCDGRVIRLFACRANPKCLRNSETRSFRTGAPPSAIAFESARKGVPASVGHLLAIRERAIGVSYSFSGPGAVKHEELFSKPLVDEVRIGIAMRCALSGR